MKKRNSDNVIRPSCFEELIQLSSCAALVAIGFVLLVKYSYQQALLPFVLAIIYFVLNGRRSIEFVDSGLSRRVGISYKFWPKEMIERVFVEVNFANQSGLYFVPQEILISVQLSGSLHKVCSSFSYGLTPMATAVAILMKQYDGKLDWRFQYGLKNEESRDFSDGEVYFQRVKIDLKKRIHRDLLVGGAFALAILAASIRASSLEAGAVLGGIVIAVFSLKVGMLVMSKETLVCPSRFKV